MRTLYTPPNKHVYVPPPRTFGAKLRSAVWRFLVGIASAVVFVLRCWKTLATLVLISTAGGATAWWYLRTDPIEAAAQARKELDRQQEVTLDLLRSILAEASDFAVWSPPVSHNEQVIRSCRDAVRLVLGREDALRHRLVEYESALEEAAKAYRRAGVAYKRFSSNRALDSSLVGGYTLLGDNCVQNASVLQERAQAVSNTSGELYRRLRFLKDSMLFLERVDFFQRTQGSQALREYEQQVTTFTTEVSAARESFFELFAAVSGDASSTPGQSTEGRPSRQEPKKVGEQQRPQPLEMPAVISSQKDSSQRRQ